LLTHPEDPVLHELYARASNAAGDPVRAKEAIAESYYLRGDIHEAILQLQKLAGLEDLDYYERARITDRLNELRTELAKMALKR
jgi:predicted Zn-dependent protease